MSSIVSRIYQLYEERNSSRPFRSHLGASGIGDPCERKLFLSFRWARRAGFSGRMLRLFETGNREEARIVENLSAVGLEVEVTDPATGRQFSYQAFGGHFGGSIDGKVSGLDESPDEVHLLEMKTHNERNFKALVKKGVRSAKPEHFWQMQVYLGMADLEHALYVAVNKNTDELYTERVERDDGFHRQALEKARRVIFADLPPPRIADEPGSFLCRWCEYKPLCHGGELPREATCRSCIHSTARLDGSWWCERHGRALSYEEQLAGCGEHLYLPPLVSRPQVDVRDDGAVVYEGGLVNLPGGKWEEG